MHMVLSLWVVEHIYFVLPITLPESSLSMTRKVELAMQLFTSYLSSSAWSAVKHVHHPAHFDAYYHYKHYR